MHRSRFLTFVAALIPGVGYMYLGLIKKGVEALGIFLLLEPVFRFIGLHDIAGILQVVFWCYTFFDTFSIASRMDKGEIIHDSDFIFQKYSGSDVFKTYKGSLTNNKNIWITVAWALIIIGGLAILNKLFSENELFGLIRSYINMYFLPVILVFAGIYLLIKNK